MRIDRRCANDETTDDGDCRADGLRQMKSRLLQKFKRAQALYESMELRGFSGEFPGAVRGRGSAASWPYALVCPALMLLARYFDLSALMGGLFV